MTCYRCGEDCSLFMEALEKAKAVDETEVYLTWHSCKKGCPKGYDKDSACWPYSEEENR